jgi:hypothetical protein
MIRFGVVAAARARCPDDPRDAVPPAAVNQRKIPFDGYQKVTGCGFVLVKRHRAADRNARAAARRNVGRPGAPDEDAKRTSRERETLV